MSNSLPHRMEPAKRHSEVLTILENRFKCFTPIIRPPHYLYQIHKIRILDRGIDWPASNTVVLFALLPTLAHGLGDSQLNPV